MDDELRDPEYQNYVSIYRGFAYVGKTLEPYTNQGLDRTYQIVYRKSAGYQACTQQCSRIYKSNTSKWCASCSGWRNLLLKTRRVQRQDVLWEHTRSWEWPHAYINIAEIYLPASWQNNNLDTKDITTACYIWENCSTEFKIRAFIIKKLREYRNKYFAHNTSLKATDLEKARVFDILKDLLKDPDVQGHINMQDCINDLSNIEQGFKIEEWMNAVQNLLQQHGLTLAEVEKGQNELREKLNNQRCHVDLKELITDVQINQQENFKEELAKFKEELISLLMEKQNRKPSSFHRMATRFKNVCQLSWVQIVVSALVALLFITRMYNYSRLPAQTPKRIQTACVSEQYSVPFQQDLPLLGYLYEHKSLTGRHWLMEHLINELISPGSSQLNGIVLIAEMGFGKSALVSKLLCPGSNELAVTIKNHVVAFHICKFDVKSTLIIERFIRRRVGFLAMKSAEYGNIISMLPETSILYNRDSCEKEPEACFDQGVSIPIKQLKDVPDVPWIIVIDALDECGNPERNHLLELLSSRIHQFPKWLKFLLTSRNMTSLTMFRKMKFEYLLSNDPRNKEDIKQFIKESFPSTRNNQDVARLIDKSEGSFVYVIQALKCIADSEDANIIPDLPSDLSDIYEINFDRQFKVAFSYAIPKGILEIVCSAINPLSRIDIHTVLRSDNISLTLNDFDTSFNSLSFFLRVGENVRVSHLALYNWLLSEQNMNYRISLQAGHTLFSNFMFGTMNNNKSKDIVELAIHVANSDDLTLRDMFVSDAYLKGNETNHESLPHKLIWKTSSVKALELLLHHYPDVNIVNEGNVTPAFIAAARGHIGQLILLNEKGAHLDFFVKGNFLISPYSVFDKIEMMKNQYYSGYSLLHIAAQHGHTSIIKFILNHNKTLLYLKNAMGLHTGHVACESGHIDIIKYLYSFDSKLFEDKCMFYAAKQNHINILKWLKQKGINFNCISDANAEEALINIQSVTFEKITDYAYVYFPSDKLFFPFINPLDDWWGVLKIDSLNVAIRHGSMDAARFLIEKFPEALQCHDAFGYTASLASIFYNRTDLLPLLTTRLATDRCAGIPEHLQKIKNLKYLQLKDMTHICPEGGSFAHLVALYSSGTEIISYSIKKRLDINWNEPDSFGNFPIHYAAANNNILFLMLNEQGTLEYRHTSSESRISYINTVALNGSTVYHIIAISGQIMSTFHLTNSLKTPIPDLKDNAGRGVIHYIVLRQLHDMPVEADQESQSFFTTVLRYLVEVSNHDIMTCDHFGRNVLHYGLTYGHALVVQYLHDYNQTVFDTMLSHKDNEGLSPIHYAINSYKTCRPFMILPLQCSFFDVFLVYCNMSKDLSKLISPWELGLLYVIQTAPTSHFRKYFEPNLTYIMEQSPYLLTAVLVYHTHLNVKILKRHLVLVNKHDFTVYSHLAIARHKPMAFISCQKPLLDSPLHYTVLTMDHKDSVFRLEYSDLNQFLNMVFYRHPSQLECSDANGYNIFHYSLIGGNIQTARVLWKTVTTLNRKVSLKDVILMAMSSRQREDHTNFIKCSQDPLEQNQERCTDIFLMEYFEKNKHNFTFSQFCKHGSKELSLVHLLAANGMASALKAVSKEFGQDILNCLNRDHFTPFYFAKLFSKDSVVSLFDQNTKLMLPHVKVEEWLIWSMLQNFPQVNTSHDLFYLSLLVSATEVSYRQIIRGQMIIKRITLQTLILHYFNADSSAALTVISSLMPNFVYCNQFFEHLYFSRHNSSIACGSDVSKVKNCFMWFETVHMILDWNIFSLRLFTKMVPKTNTAFKQFKQFFKDIEQRCHKNYTIVLEKRKLINLILCLKKLYSVLNQMLVEETISNYIQGGKSDRIIVPSSYNFLQLRMKTLKFNSDKNVFSFGKSNPLIAVNGQCLYEYQYLSIIKPLLAYKNLKKNLRVDRFSLIGTSKIESFEIQYTKLKEPFSDLII